MIGLMDCNNFFVSCERLFRPDLRNVPVAVLSSNDGCIVARSQEVKDLGIPMGVPLFEVRDIVKKHHITLFSSNFPLYRDISARVMSALREECSSVSVYSIDEAFFKVEKGVTEETIRDIRSRIIQKTGIPVSFGIAPTKTTAKIANADAKKGSGVTWYTLESLHERYSTLSCGSVWGIGRQTSARLTRLGVNTVSEFLARGKSFARKEFGVVGERLCYELEGVAMDDVEAQSSLQSSIMSTRSFHEAIQDKEVLLSALGHHIAHIAEKLRSKEAVAMELRILCAPSRFGEFAGGRTSERVEFDVPTNDTTALLSAARALFERIYNPGISYKKAGALVSGLIPERYVARSLFERGGTEAGGGIYQTVDRINERFGRDVVHPAVISSTDAWAPNAKLRSPDYTTRWSEIPRIKAI